MERALALRARCTSACLARFLADLMLAKGKLLGKIRRVRLVMDERNSVKRLRNYGGFMGLSQTPDAGRTAKPDEGVSKADGSKRPSMLRSVLSFSSMTMISRVFGLVRDMVISRGIRREAGHRCVLGGIPHPEFHAPAVRGRLVHHRFRAGVHRDQGKAQPRRTQASGRAHGRIARRRAVLVVAALGIWCSRRR